MNKTFSTLLPSSLIATGVTLGSMMPAQAFVLTSQLTGDPRPGNPDNLIIDVTITSGENSVAANQAKFVVDINSPFHSDIKLDDFFFNIDSYTTSDISLVPNSSTPSVWNVFGNGNNANGSGGANFAFSIDRTGGNPAGDVNNSTNLEFIVELNSGNFQQSDFLNADSSTSNDNQLGSGQLGAHLQSLTVNNTTCQQGNCSDSGFALGNYEHDNGSPPPEPPVSVPEPSSLFGLAFMVGAFKVMRRRKS